MSPVGVVVAGRTIGMTIEASMAGTTASSIAREGLALGMGTGLGRDGLARPLADPPIG